MRRTVHAILLSRLASGLTAGLAAVVAAAVLSAPVAAASPSPRVAVERLSGSDRYTGSVAVSQAMSLRHADTVYLASGENFPDALSAASVAGLAGVPLLLTPRDRLHEAVRREIVRLTPSTVVVVGGEKAIAESVALELSRSVSGATITRIAGADRYEVSRRLVADEAVGAPVSPWMIAATGRDFPDALSAAPVAAALESPVLLVDGSAHEPSVADAALLAEREVTSVLLTGGVASISSPFETALKRTVLTQRYAGPDRFATSVALNSTFDEADVAYLASGSSFPDALSGAPLAARFGAPLYLARPDCVPPAVLEDLERLGVERVVLLGGPAVLGEGAQALTPCP